MKNNDKGGITPNPMATLHNARKCFSVKIQIKTNGTKAETTKPRSIIALVNQLKYLFLLPGGN